MMFMNSLSTVLKRTESTLNRIIDINYWTEYRKQEQERLKI